MEMLYTLQLKDGKYYVGKTTDVKKRFKEHQSGSGAAWTREHIPLRLLECRPLKDEHDENNTTKNYMKKYGIENVRGGSYTQLELPTHTRTVIENEIRGNTGACFRCGEQGHFARNCKSQVWSCEDCGNNYVSKQEALECCEEEDDVCRRCGRDSHTENECYAYSDVNGNYIKGKRNFEYGDWVFAKS